MIQKYVSLPKKIIKLNYEKVYLKHTKIIKSYHEISVLNFIIKFLSCHLVF